MRVLDRAIAYLAAALLIAFTVVILVDVACRYWLHIPLNWPAEGSILLFQWTVFLGAALAVRRRTHFALDLIVRRWSARARRAAQACVLLTMAATAVLLVRLGIEMTRRSWPSRYPTLPLSHGVAYLGIPISAALMLVFTVGHLVAFFRGGGAEGVPE